MQGLSKLPQLILGKKPSKRYTGIDIEFFSNIFQSENIVNGTSLEEFKSLGNFDGLFRELKVDPSVGLETSNTRDIEERIKKFDTNAAPEVEEKSIWDFVIESLEDQMLRILLAASAVSLIIGILHEGIQKGWIEGTAIFFAVFVVVTITSFNNWSKEKQFAALNRENQKKDVTVERDGMLKKISVYDLLVGDILNLSIGMTVPVDGILFKGSVTMDESAMTGESELFKKTCDLDKEPTPFLMSGTQVVDGQGKMVVCAVGKNSLMGRSNSIMSEEGQKTALEQKLEELADMIGSLGFLAAIFIGLIILLKAIAVKLIKGESIISHDLLDSLINAFIIAVTVIVVAIPEGLPMAVTISLAYSVRQMKDENNLVRHLEASEIMGNVNNVCTDKTGTLTEGVMSLRNIYIGDYTYKTNLDDKPEGKAKEVLLKSLINSKNDNTFVNLIGNKQVATGNFTECAILQYLLDNKLYLDTYKESDPRLGLLPFKSDYKFEAHLYPKDSNGVYKLYIKGAPENIFKNCTKFLEKDGSESNFNDNAISRFVDKLEEFAEAAQRTLAVAYRFIPESEYERACVNNELFSFDFFTDLIHSLTLTSVLGIADAPRKDVKNAIAVCNKAGVLVRMVTGDNIKTAIAISKDVGILNEFETEKAKRRVKRLQDEKNSGKKEIDVSNLSYLQTEQDSDDFILAMEGSEFRRITGGYRKVESEDGTEKNAYELVSPINFERYTKHLKVIARATPEDKFLLVLGLKQLDNIVAVTGDGTNDAPALKKSDVGFAMGIRGTDIAKEASDIVLLNDSFSSIVTAMKFGRNVYDCIRKFLQFQLTTNVVAVFMTLIGGIVLHDSPLNAIQMLWVNLIMDSFASLALATEYPTDEILNRKPYPRKESILTNYMILNIVTQAIFQIVILMFIIFYGDFFFMVNSDRDLMHYEWPDDKGYHFTIFFNIFVLMQVFNSINARKLRKDEVNVFEGILSNKLYLFIQLFIVLGQIFMVQFGGRALRTRPLTIVQHIFCLLISSLSLVVCFLVKQVQFFTDGEKKTTSEIGIQADGLDTSKLQKKTSFGLLRKQSSIVGNKSFSSTMQKVVSSYRLKTE